jgi:pimeloyl-ACP methyl ester carboxylesterase
MTARGSFTIFLNGGAASCAGRRSAGPARRSPHDGLALAPERCRSIDGDIDEALERLARKARRILLVAALGMLATGCGTKAKSAAHSQPRTASVESCVKPGRDTRIVQVAAIGGPVVVIGSGTSGAVMANQDSGNLCQWLPLARGLARAGMRAVIFDWVGGPSADDVLAVARQLRRLGVRRVALVGASTGGRVVLHAAAEGPTQVDAVVTLSAERTGRGGYPTLADARHLRTPALYVGTTNDGYTTFGAETRTLFRATRAAGSRLLLVPGAEHGTDILESSNGQRVIHAVATFVQTQVRRADQGSR